MLRTRREEWSLEFRRMLELLARDDRDPRDLEEERREGTPIFLPLPQGALRPAPCLEPGEIDRRRRQELLGFFPGQRDELADRDAPPFELDDDTTPEVRPAVSWGWKDDRPQVLVRRTDTSSDRAWTFYAPDRMFAQLFERVSPEGEVEWWLRVECKARELYADGLRSWMERWLGLWTWLLQGTWALPETAADCGWNVSQWHVNSDFVGIDLYKSDLHSFTGPRRMTEHARALRQDEHEVWVKEQADGPWLQTLQFGRKGSDVCLVAYRKGDQLRDEKHVEPAESMYAPLWVANSWVPEVDGDPLRIEWRLRKKGLRYQDKDRTRTVYDFRKPHMLLDEDAVRKFWAHLCAKRRLVHHDRSRKEDSSNDPRWDVVAAAAATEAPDIRQIPHEVRFKTRDERQGQRIRAMALHAVKYAQENGALCTSWADVGAVLGELMQRWASGDPELSRLIEINPHPLDLAAAAQRYRPAVGFFAIEAAAAYPSFCERVGRRLPFAFEERREHLAALAYLWGRAPPMEERPMTEQQHDAEEKIAAARAGFERICKAHGEAAEAVFFEMVKRTMVHQMASTPGLPKGMARLALAALPKDEARTSEEREGQEKIDAADSAVRGWLEEHGDAAEALLYEYTTRSMTTGSEAAAVQSNVPAEYVRAFASGVPAAAKHVGKDIFARWSEYMSKQLFDGSQGVVN